MLWGLVSKAPREPGTKSAHNIHFLHPCLIGLVAHLRCSGVLVPKLQDEPVQVTKPAHNAQFSLFPCHWLGTYVMCCEGLVSKPAGEPGSKPAHNVHFLNSWVIGSELMSSALGAWCRNHKVNRGQNQLTMDIFSIPV